MAIRQTPSKTAIPPAYAAAGVDVEAGYQAVSLIKKHVQRTYVPGVKSEIGDFAGLFALDLSEFPQPILVGGTDGVGTKLKYAFALDKHDSIGIDCVAMCVNDIICLGAKPLYFLDYIACGKNQPERIEQIVKGISIGCLQAGCALLGGETAEMPGFYPPQEYDLAGSVTGVVNQSEMITHDQQQAGDIVIALASSGLHSNGYSLVRKIIDPHTADLHTPIAQLAGQSLGQVVLEPTRIYVSSVLKLIKKVKVKGISNITGGGFYENVPRMLAPGIGAQIHLEQVKVLPIFKYLQRMGQLGTKDLFNTFNMGVGMTLVVAPQEVKTALAILEAAGEQAYPIGELVLANEPEGQVELVGEPKC